MQPFQRDFIQFALDQNVLKFGEFTLKSGRQSPYFFNAGGFQTSRALAMLGEFYAAALQASGQKYDMLFGPAYKGIPLVSSLAVALANEYNLDVPYAFNRKEAKTHGEGGTIVGAPLTGKVMIVDDVITAGTAVREVISIIEAGGAKPAGVLIALDRQERGQQALSAIQEIEQTYNIPVVSIIKLNQILEFVQSEPAYARFLPAIQQYRSTYGIAETE